MLRKCARMLMATFTPSAVSAVVKVEAQKMVMGKQQTYVIQCGFALVILMGIYPPWIYVDENRVGHSMGYSFIWKAPIEKLSGQMANNLDYNILLFQLALIFGTAGASCYMLRHIPNKSIYARK
jgi:hypothetical protein